MLAYWKSDLDAMAIGATLERWAAEGVLDEDARKTLAAKNPCPFYSPNVFVRIGLFLFGWVCAASAIGLVFLMTEFPGHGGNGGISATLLFCGLAALFPVEGLIRKRKPFFRAGLEEALLYCALGCLIAGVLVAADFTHRPAYALTGPIAVVLALAALRYADSLLSALSLASVFLTLFFLCDKAGGAARQSLPFLAMAVSVLGIAATGRALCRPSLRYWKHLWQSLRFLTLLTCYLGGNYFVVREMSRELLGYSPRSSEDIPFFWFFRLTTFGLPFLYLGLGLARKDRLCLWAGLASMAMAVFTYKHYYSTLPLEVGLTLTGTVMMASAWAAIRYLRTPKHGLSVQPVPSKNRDGLLDAESLELLHSLGGQAHPQAPATDAPADLRGGGGSFSGGGASGSF